MKKYVYKIKNQINSKVYIGQSNDVSRRFKEHKRSASTLIGRAIAKYGSENFSFIPLYYGSNYNEVEQYFIAFFESTNPSKGYNIQTGGESPPILTGEASRLHIHSDQTINEIIDLLLYTKIEQNEIAQLYGCNKTTISRINLGLIRRREHLQYPLRRKNLIKQSVEWCKWLLCNSDLNRTEIMELTGVNVRNVRAIRTGQNHRDPTLSYPLGGRQPRYQLSDSQKSQLYSLLKADSPLSEISSIIGIGELRIQLFNEGRIYFEEDRVYPISINIKKSVETRSLIAS